MEWLKGRAHSARDDYSDINFATLVDNGFDLNIRNKVNRRLHVCIYSMMLMLFS